MKLAVKTLQGDVLEVVVDDAATIGELKARLAEARPGARAYKVLWKGADLQDERSVTELGLSEASSLYVVFKTAPDYAAAGAARGQPLRVPVRGSTFFFPVSHFPVSHVRTPLVGLQRWRVSFRRCAR